MGFPRWMPPLLPAFGVWRVGLGWCRAATTTEHTEKTHIRGAHLPRRQAVKELGDGVTRITNGLYDLQCILARIVSPGLCTECGSAPTYMKLPSYLLL